MFGRLVLAGAVLSAICATPAAAGQFGLLHWLYNKCDSVAKSSQCAVQYVNGNDNVAVTEQATNRKHGTQLGLTFQHGDGNVAYTGQVGKDQISLTSQSGSSNGSFTYQQGSYNYSQTTQNTNGSWAASSSIGDGTYSNVTISN
jgi:hypothetical protein